MKAVQMLRGTWLSMEIDEVWDKTCTYDHCADGSLQGKATRTVRWNKPGLLYEPRP